MLTNGSAHCRRTKIRCDRQLPCNSCRSRGITCEYASQRAALDAYGVNTNAQTNGEESASPGSNELRALRAEHDALKARFSTIERVVLGNHGEASSAASSGTLPIATPEAVLDTRTPQSPRSNDVVSWAANLHWLEGIAASNTAKSSRLVRPFSIRVSTIQNLISEDLRALSSEAVLIPSLEEAVRLIVVYQERYDTIRHIVYWPHCNKNMEQSYSDLQYGQPKKPSHLALLLAMLASVVETCELVPDALAAHELSTHWLKGSLDILENIWRSQTHDLETVQATIIAIYHLYHTEAFSSKARVLHATAVSLARDLGLHKTDITEPNGQEALSQGQVIDLEIRRRVWWQLVTMDWGFLLSSVLHEGSYCINPRQMQVTKPRNINDEDLATMPAGFSWPTTEPTTMAFYLCGIRVAEVCREVADATWNVASVKMTDTLYDCTIRPLDRKFQDLLATTPPFLRTDRSEQAPSMRMFMQRYFNYLSILTRRCRLHLPYLMRNDSCRSCGYSRYVCLDSARSVLKLRDHVSWSNLDPAGSSHSLPTVGFLPHFFFATTILAVDFSFNRDNVDEVERKAEIHSACTVFENAGPSANVFLDVLKGVMQKHKLRIKESAYDKTSDASLEASETAKYQRTATVETQHAATTFDADLNLDTLWQSFLNTDPGIEEWDELFSHLDAGVQ